VRVYNVKNIKYHDRLAEKKRRVFVLKTLLFIGLAIVFIGLIFYLVFFSSFFKISQVNVNGLDKVSKDEFNGQFNKRLNSKWIGLLKHQGNVAFFNSDAFRAEILAVFPEIKDISVKKEPPHTLNIDITERITTGIWCFASQNLGEFAELATGSSDYLTPGSSDPLTTSCKYFDEEGNVWGEAVRSVGFLVLVVDDLRQNAEEINTDLLSDIIFMSKRLKEIDVFTDKFTVPDEFIGDFSAFTSGGYELLFSTDSDMGGQLEVLKIFLAEKRDELGFNPQSIDLRINGRVYFK